MFLKIYFLEYFSKQQQHFGDVDEMFFSIELTNAILPSSGPGQWQQQKSVVGGHSTVQQT